MVQQDGSKQEEDLFQKILDANEGKEYLEELSIERGFLSLFHNFFYWSISILVEGFSFGKVYHLFGEVALVHRVHLSKLLSPCNVSFAVNEESVWWNEGAQSCSFFEGVGNNLSLIECDGEVDCSSEKMSGTGDLK
jgi:hypothetical protein